MTFDILPELSQANSGTELVKSRVIKYIKPELLEDVQVVVSRLRNYQKCKYHVFWAHDLEDDPETYHLFNNGHNIYDHLVFVSNWQMQRFIDKYAIPWSKCSVIPNCIEQIEPNGLQNSKIIKLIYHTTPHRGLNLLVDVFDRLSKQFDNIELNVYSSFKIYGIEQRDLEYKELFDLCESHPKINSYGTVSNQTIRDELSRSDIFAFPSIWPETSCVSLIEAMSAGLICMHPNYGALFETSGSFNVQYQWNESAPTHKDILYDLLSKAITNFDYTRNFKHALNSRTYANMKYSLNNSINLWNNLLANL